jgi:hypothetical protein
MHPLRALWIMVIASPALSYSTTATFIADFIKFQRQAARPSTVRAFVCWKEGTVLISLYLLSNHSQQLRSGWRSQPNFLDTLCYMLSVSLAVFLLLYLFSLGQARAMTSSSTITQNDAPQSVGLLWTNDQLVAEFEPTIAVGERP